MRIGMILDAPFPPDPRVENEAVTLISEGHEVYLYSLDYTRKLPANEEINGIKVYRQQFSKWVFKMSALAYTFPFYHWILAKSIANFLAINDIEAIHIHDMQVARCVINTNKHFHLPVILDLHENRPEIMKFYPHVKSGLGKFLIRPTTWKKYEFKYISSSRNTIVVTDAAREYYQDNIPISESKFCVLPNTVRKSFYTQFEKNQNIIDEFKDKFTLLYLGDTGQRRGVAQIISALPLLIQAIPNINLVVVGWSNYDDYLKTLTKKLDLLSFVDFRGWQPFDLFPSYILASEIGICPIHKNIHHETTYANKIFQYLSFGKPIIVSDCKAQAQLTEKYKCGLVFKDQDVRDLAEKVLKLYSDHDFYRDCSENGKNAIEKDLNWEVMSRSFSKLYEKL